MKPPHTPRPARDLPKRVPGSARHQGSASGSPSAGSEPGGTAFEGAFSERAEPSSGGPVAGSSAAGGARSAASPDVPLPRLTRYSSLGSRRPGAGVRPAAPHAGAGDPPPFASATGARGGPSDPVDVTATATGDNHRPLRGRRRTVLVVVGVVAVLAAGGVLLGVGGEADDKSGSASSVVDSDPYEDIDGGWSDDLSPSPGAARTPSGAHGRPGEHGTQRPSPSGTGPADSEIPGAPPGRATDASAAPEAPKPAASSGPAPGVTLYSHASGRCLDVAGGRAVQGAGLQIWDCTGSADQHWTFPADGTMRTLGMCVQLAGGSAEDGTLLELARCDGSAKQRFDLNSAHDLTTSLGGHKCADVRDERTDNGTRVQVWSCAGSPNQKWSES